MSLSRRLARAGVRLAARGRSSDELRDEWLAELSAMTRERQMLAFAASLLVSPSTVATAGGVTLLAAALANAVHTGGPLLMVAAAGVMVLVGLRIRMPAAVAAGLLGPALFAFLFIGNAVAVMPFMGFVDVAPAALLWTVGMLAVVRLARGPIGLVLGGLGALSVATIAGSLHAAHVLGVSLWSAPAWLPQALWPQGSDPLALNAAAMVGPMLLGAVFVVTLALRAETDGAALRSSRWQVVAGLGGALAGLAVCQVTAQSGTGAGAAFGFGFAAGTLGQAAVAVLAAMLAVRLTEPAV